ncbi:hypothetical protein GCM10014713_49000 [Streptomyces purpureus]|uniref:Lipoprotein n=2 Tax=Streptomyces purpureus TaxID=1951 RepID=A0A918LT33_9ACTN|nr:hypothetical protein GCM10014713_49000 [Streptomyces purpureus]
MGSMARTFITPSTRTAAAGAAVAVLTGCLTAADAPAAPLVPRVTAAPVTTVTEGSTAQVRVTLHTTKPLTRAVRRCC